MQGSVWHVLLLSLILPSRCQVPPWPRTYNMAQSTIIMPASVNGNWDYSFFSLAAFGIVDFDQSVNKRAWVDARPMDVQATMLEQAAIAKRINPAQHVWIYRNSIKMYPYLSAVRTILADPAFKRWFLPYRVPSSIPYANDPCDHNFQPAMCSTLFHDQWGSPGYPAGSPPDPTSNCPAPYCDCGAAEGVVCGEYYLDFRRWNDTRIYNRFRAICVALYVCTGHCPAY